MTAEAVSPELSLVCPRPEHKGSIVVRFGTRTSTDRTVAYQRYRCAPAHPAAAAASDERYALHTFQLPLRGGVPEQVPYVAPPSCPTHPDGHVVRNGFASPPPGRKPKSPTRRAHPAVPRQRYRCTPPSGTAHSFFPKLPRQAVGAGEYCEHCEEPRCVHRGETVVARGHRYTTVVVAQALAELGAGATYARTSLLAFQRTQPERLHELLTPLTLKEQTKARKNAWRLAADWCEAFSPVLWEPWAEARLSDMLAIAELKPKERPVRVAIIDDIPVFAKSVGAAKPLQRFSVLALSEVLVDPGRRTRDTRLRLLRAYPRHDEKAYLLLLNELGYVPDVVIADGGKGIGGALRTMQRRHGADFQQMLSAYHVRKQLRRLFATLERKHPGGFSPGDLDDDLETWKFCHSEAAWQQWWSRFEQRATAQGIPYTTWQTDWVRDYKPLVDAQMPMLDEIKVLPRTTGALEATLFNTIKPAILGRARTFGNLVRTNRLMDLMVLHADGQLASTAAVARALRRDVETTDGYGPPVRAITDPRMYRSLLDASQLDHLVRDAGL